MPLCLPVNAMILESQEKGNPDLEKA